MRNQPITEPSEFKQLPNIEYFDFEEDFMEKGLRCIPMVVRCKLDKAGIKLKLAEWVTFSANEKIELATMQCEGEDEISRYHNHVSKLIYKYTGKEGTMLPVDFNPAWSDTKTIPEELQKTAKEFMKEISLEQWRSLTDLQRFALVKLCRPGHENKNFPKAIKEFNLV